MQFHHRLGGYLLCLCAAGLIYAAVTGRGTSNPVRQMSFALGLGIICQAGLGIWTLMWATPIDLGLAHQAAAALVFGLATGFLWVTRRT